MNGGKQNGYTIIEVMIFLAVSGVMFLIAAVFISGKQASTQFSQGVNEFASRLQSTIQEIADGQYTSLNTLSCTTLSGTNPPTLSSSGSTTGQGTNGDCVFLGKVYHLSEASDPVSYEVFSIIGKRADSSGTPITDLQLAQPKAIYDYSGSDPALTGLVDQETMPQSLPVKGVLVDGSVHGAFGFGLLTKPSDTTLQSGNQSVLLYYIAGIGNTTSQGTAASLLRYPPGSFNYVQAQKVTICIDDGKRFAEITIGANNDQLGVTVDRKGSFGC